MTPKNAEQVVRNALCTVPELVTLLMKQAGTSLAHWGD